jgi:hypothetical protein
MNRSALIFHLFVLALLLSSCSSKPQESSNISEISEEAVVASTPTAEPVYLYGTKSDLPGRLTVKLTDVPILFPSGYLRLAGIVQSKRIIALFDIGGKSFVLQEGEKIDDYRVVGITNNHVLLKKEK